MTTEVGPALRCRWAIYSSPSRSLCVVRPPMRSPMYPGGGRLSGSCPLENQRNAVGRCTWRFMISAPRHPRGFSKDAACISKVHAVSRIARFQSRLTVTTPAQPVVLRPFVPHSLTERFNQSEALPTVHTAGAVVRRTCRMGPRGMSTATLPLLPQAGTGCRNLTHVTRKQR